MALLERIGLHLTFVRSVARGERNLSLSSLLRLAQGLKLNPADLVDGWLGCYPAPEPGPFPLNTLSVIPHRLQ